MKVYTLFKGVTADTVSPELVVPQPSAGAKFYPYFLDRKAASGGSVTFLVEGRADAAGQWATLYTWTTPSLANRANAPEYLPLLPRLRLSVFFSGSPGPCDGHVVVPSQV